MAHFLTLGRYSPQGAAAVKTEGMTGRKKAVQAFVDATGLKLLGYWGVREADWDFVILTEGDDNGAAQQLAAQITSYSSGAFQATAWYCLAEAEEVDEAMSRVASYRPPGAAS
jgi:uncharacterized protein with GYD domain